MAQKTMQGVNMGKKMPMQVEATGNHRILKIFFSGWGSVLFYHGFVSLKPVAPKIVFPPFSFLL